jgi:hypothetical protein
LSLEVGPESTTFTFNSELVSQVAWKLIFWGVAHYTYFFWTNHVKPG